MNGILEVAGEKIHYIMPGEAPSYGFCELWKVETYGRYC